MTQTLNKPSDLNTDTYKETFISIGSSAKTTELYFTEQLQYLRLCQDTFLKLGTLIGRINNKHQKEGKWVVLLNN